MSEPVFTHFVMTSLVGPIRQQCDRLTLKQDDVHESLCKSCKCILARHLHLIIKNHTNYTLQMIIGSWTLANLQGTSLLQNLLELSTLLLRHCVITTTNKLATNEHTGYRATTCQLVQVVLDCFTILPLVKLHTEDTTVN